MDKTIIYWKPFTVAELPDTPTKIVILINPSCERDFRWRLATDVWNGNSLLRHQEHRVSYFCPLNELTVPELPETSP
jgi:hypothetical protein